MSNSPGKVIQVGEVLGDLNLTSVTYARNDDIGVDLRHEDREVHLRASAVERFHVTVTNRSDRARQLGFRVEGATGLQWEIVADSAGAVALPANGEIELRLVVHCTSTAPMAGAAEVKVLVGDAAEGIWWPSNPKPVFVEPAPRLGVSMNGPDVRMSGPGTYELTVWLVNEGNTALPVDVVTFADFDGLEHPEWLDSTSVRVVGGPSFTLGYGDAPAGVLVKIALPGQAPLDKTWNIPLRALVKREDAPPVEQSFTVLQHGLLSDLAEWGRTEVTHKRRRLATWGAILLAVGIWFGWFIGGPASAPEKPPVQAGAATSTTVPPAEVRYSPMPCDPGTSVLVLHSFNEPIAAADMQAYLDFETVWIRHHVADLPALTDQQPRLTTRDAVCPPALNGIDAAYTRFIWIGPFPSADTQSLCVALRKLPKDCFAARVA